MAGTYLSVAGTQCWLPWLHMALDKILGAMSRKIGIDSAQHRAWSPHNDNFQ